MAIKTKNLVQTAQADTASADAGSPPAPSFVLAATYPEGNPLAGQPQYFRFWTVFGPAATPDLAEAERFRTAQAAMESPAYSHWASFYEPKLVEEVTQ